MKKALLKVGYSCNNYCQFCHSRPLQSHPDLATAQVEDRMEVARRRGAEMIVFSGGEPTLRRDIQELARLAAGRGLKTGLITNGRRLAYPRFAAELAALGFRYAYVSFHSHDPGRHTLSAGTDSFPQTLAAIANLAKLDVALTVNTVVTRHNVDNLEAVVDTLAALHPGKIKLSITEPKGAVLDHAGLCPPLNAAAQAIARAIRYGQARYPGQRFGCEGLAPCLIGGFEALNDDLVTNGFVLFQEAFESEPTLPDVRNRSKPPTCADCVWWERCPGVYTAYLTMTPRPALRPEVRLRSNSFAYRRTGESEPGPGRILMKERGRVWACATQTSDFSEAERRDVLALGQLYAAARNRRVDFGRDLIKLRPARGEGGGVYEKMRANVFAPFEAALEKRIRRLRGAVLEVGCGAIRFREILARLARSGALRYTGIDPELPEAPAPYGMRLLRADIESFEAPDAAFDHVLVLRSYNHIRLPSVAFPKIRRLLKPGGRLTVVDGTAYALLLPQEPESARPGEFEHYRNHDSRQARTLLESFGFETIREVPVRAAGCNEWLLELRPA